MAQEHSKQSQGEEEDYTAPFGPEDSVLVKDLNFSYGDRQVRNKWTALLPVPCSARHSHAHHNRRFHATPRRPHLQVLSGINLRLKRGSRCVPRGVCNPHHSTPSRLHPLTHHPHPHPPCDSTSCLLIGANGAGKSTLLRILGGRHLTKPDEAVTVLGMNAFRDTKLNMVRAYMDTDWGMRTVAFAGASSSLDRSSHTRTPASLHTCLLT